MSGPAFHASRHLASMWARRSAFAWPSSLRRVTLAHRPDTLDGVAVAKARGVVFENSDAAGGELRPVKPAQFQLPFHVQWLQFAPGQRRLRFGRVEKLFVEENRSHASIF